MEITGVNRLPRLPQILWRRQPCPLCGSVQFKQAEPGVLDGLLGMVSLRPVRCVNCWRRYYRFAHKQ
jgi:hypothetical protein